MPARYSIGIDLGTTNSVVGWTPLEGDAPSLSLLQIPQAVAAGQIDRMPRLPSFLYLPPESETEAYAPPWEDSGPGVPGDLARSRAAEDPQRVVVAAKSWLCHSRVNRQEPILPWKAPAEVPKVSPLVATRRYLEHLAAAWNTEFPDAPLVEQEVVLTVPASFDPAARELTREAALAAGLPNDFILLEEPQAAVYRWLSARGEDWRKELKKDDRLLVVDVGGGTTDLTLVVVAEEEGNVVLRRLAVGNHLLVGGDNMDLALAHRVSQKLQSEGHRLDPWQSVSLWHACRAAKEKLLAVDGPEEYPISVLGRGSRLIGGTITTTLERSEVAELLLGGFLPDVEADARPARRTASGFQDIGLPYESDPAITRHVAAFLADHADETAGGAVPTHLLLNGGVFRAAALRSQIESVIGSWNTAEPPRPVGGPEDLDDAVALGAAYYGWAKRRGGVRIRGGTARSYYVGIETAGLAIPGAPRPLRALCVAPRGMEEGSEADVPGEEVGLVVGQPAQFRFFGSAVRKDDQVGDTLDSWDPDELVETNPLELTLEGAPPGEDPFVPVRFRSRVTELGMFELWCRSTRDDQQWKLEFSVREDEGE